MRFEDDSGEAPGRSLIDHLDVKSRLLFAGDETERSEVLAHSEGPGRVRQIIVQRLIKFRCGCLAYLTDDGAECLRSEWDGHDAELGEQTRFESRDERQIVKCRHSLTVGQRNLVPRRAVAHEPIGVNPNGRPGEYAAEGDRGVDLR